MINLQRDIFQYTGKKSVRAGNHAQAAQTVRPTPQEKEMIRREIEATDHAIDALVVQLYGLTEAEIRIVEAG